MAQSFPVLMLQFPIHAGHQCGLDVFSEPGRTKLFPARFLGWAEMIEVVFISSRATAQVVGQVRANQCPAQAGSTNS